jgi:ATP-dependent RNA helicase DeaD
MDISWVYQRDPVEITVRPVEENRPDIQQYQIELDGRDKKLGTMVALLHGGQYERAIAFCNTKNMTDRLAGLLKMEGIPCEAIHGDIQQRVRENTLKKFKDGKLRVLVATDVAARGLDIDDVDAVFNYDVPDEQEYYVHRIGRTGRAKKHGVAYTLVASVTESVKMRDIARNTKADIQLLRYDKDGCLNLVENV